MTLLAEFEVPIREVVLAGTLGDLPTAVIDFERQVPSVHGPFPYVSVQGVDRATFERRAAGDPSVASIVHVHGDGGQDLYRTTWRDLGPFVRGLRADTAVLRARGTSAGWEFTIRFDSRDALEYFRAYCDRHDLRFGLRRLSTGGDLTLEGFAVTSAQREALVLALERGYFEVPRGCTLSEIAEELGISTRAASERLRRGHANLVQGIVS